MHRLAGQDAIFLYRETPTSIMHTLKVSIVKVLNTEASFEELQERLIQTLYGNPILRKRVVPVPLGIHHPVMVDDPDFDINAHIFRAAIPAPGTMRELDDMVAQIGSTLLDRSRPLWEVWILTGLESGHVAIVHKVHHSMLDGMTYVGFLTRGWHEGPIAIDDNYSAPPLPSGSKLFLNAMVDHLKHDIWHLWPLLNSFIGNLKELYDRRKAGKGPDINPLTAEFPRTRFNYALGVKRSFSSCQVPLDDIKALKNQLAVTVNDVVLAIVAGALRSYLISHKELPDQPLALSIPVGADEPGSQRQMGNRVTAMMSMLHTQIADPLERLYAIKADTEQGKEILEVFGKQQWGDLMEYVPPGIMAWSCRRKFRLKPANKPGFRPNCNIVVSNVPGPREKLGTADGELVAVYSAGVLGEGLGLNVTVWSYMDQLSIGALACQKAMPDLHLLTEAIPAAVEELQVAVQRAAA